MNFFDENFVRGMVKKSIPAAKVDAIDAWSFVASAIAKSPATLYVGFIVDALTKEFSIGAKSYTIDAAGDSGKGWLVFDGFIDSGTGDEVLFTGYRVTLQYPGPDVIIAPPVIDNSIWRINSWYNGTAFQLGVRTTAERVNISNLAGLNADYTPVNGYVSSLSVNTIQDLTIKIFNGSTQLKTGMAVMSANNKSVNYWSDSKSLTIMNLERGVVNMRLIIGSQTIWLNKMEVGKKYTLYYPGFTTANVLMQVFDAGSPIMLNDFSFVVTAGVDLVPSMVDLVQLPEFEQTV